MKVINVCTLGYKLLTEEQQLIFERRYERFFEAFDRVYGDASVYDVNDLNIGMITPETVEEHFPECDLWVFYRGDEPQDFIEQLGLKEGRYKIMSYPIDS
jgi:hypothetical protein